MEGDLLNVQANWVEGEMNSNLTVFWLKGDKSRVVGNTGGTVDVPINHTGGKSTVKKALAGESLVITTDVTEMANLLYKKGMEERK